MRSTEAAPTLGPTGSWLSVTIAMSTAVASSTDAGTPTARSMPVARDLRGHRHEDQDDDARSAAREPQDREPAPEAASAMSAQRVEPHAHDHRAGQTGDRRPPRQPERSDQRDEGERGQDALDEKDRDLRGDDGGDAWGGVRRRSPQGRDPRRGAELAVDLAAEVAHARRAEQRAAVDGAPAAATQTHHAPERETSASSCSAAAATRMPTGAECSAVTNASRWRATTATSAAATPTGTHAPRATRRAPTRAGRTALIVGADRRPAVSSSPATRHSPADAASRSRARRKRAAAPSWTRCSSRRRAMLVGRGP
jgi:hypothetical protein